MREAFRKSAVPFAAPSSFWTGIENRAGRRHPFRRDVPVTSDLSEGPACQVRFSRRDLLVRSDQHRSTTRRPSSGTTSVPLRPFGGTCLSGPINTDRRPVALHRARQACPSDLSEGPACQVRFSRRDPLVGSAFCRQGQFMSCPDNTSGPWHAVAKWGRVGGRGVDWLAVRTAK